MIDGILGKDFVIKVFSTIVNFLITGGGILGKDLVIHGILG